MNVILVQKLAAICGDKILALRRSKTDPGRPLTWDLLGGGVDETDKGLRQGLLREVSEETGLDLTKVEFEIVNVHSFVNGDGVLNVWLGYVAKVDHQLEVKLSFEHDQEKWVTKKEFLQLDFGYAKNGLAEQVEKIEF